MVVATDVPHQRGQPQQDLVAGFVSVGVVDLFEVVEVEHEQ